MSQFGKIYVATDDNKSKNLKDGHVAHLSCETSEIYHKTADSGMLVEIKVGDRVLKLLVDTGATFILV